MLDFLEHVTSQKLSYGGSVYGFTLTHTDGRRACYVGHEMETCRPEQYIGGLFPPREGGGPPSNGSEWNVPGRLKFLWREGFRVDKETVLYTLNGLPKCFETAITFAIEGVLGIDKAIGGVLALDTRIPGVADCVALQRLHDATPARCLACGSPGHHANQKLDGVKVCQVDSLCDERLPLHVQRLERQANVGAARASGVTRSEEGSLKRIASNVEQLTNLKHAKRSEQEAQRDSALPLKTQRQWESKAERPRLSEADLRTRLQAYLVGPELGYVIEQVLGGAVIDMHAFASGEIYKDYERPKEAMKDAKRIMTSAQCASRKATGWVKDVLPQHMDRAIVDGRLTNTRDFYLEKRTCRRGGEKQSKGVVMRVDDVVALYCS